MQTKPVSQSELDNIISKRLATQQGSRNKIIRESGRNLAKIGKATLGSGFFRTVTVVASL